MNKSISLTLFTVTVPNIKGQLTKLTTVLTRANLDLNSLNSHIAGPIGLISFTVAGDVAPVMTALQSAGFAATQTPVVGVTLSNKPGELDRLASYLGESGININGIYGTTPVGAEYVSIVLGLDISGTEFSNTSAVLEKFFAPMGDTAVAA